MPLRSLVLLLSAVILFTVTGFAKPELISSPLSLIDCVVWPDEIGLILELVVFVLVCVSLVMIR